MFFCCAQTKWSHKPPAGLRLQSLCHCRDFPTLAFACMQQKGSCKHASVQREHRGWSFRDDSGNIFYNASAELQRFFRPDQASLRLRLCSQRNTGFPKLEVIAPKGMWCGLWSLVALGPHGMICHFKASLGSSHCTCHFKASLSILSAVTHTALLIIYL